MGDLPVLVALSVVAINVVGLIAFYTRVLLAFSTAKEEIIERLARLEALAEFSQPRKRNSSR